MNSISKTVILPLSNAFRRQAAAKVQTQPQNGSALLDLIKSNTKPTTHHLTPELQLNLITSECPLWNAYYTDTPFPDPYWAFFWPGGQAIARYILDNPKTVKNLNILDFGCGSGACGIAAKKSGAAKVTLNDIDLLACAAASLNARDNNVKVEIDSSNLLNDCEKPNWDLILVGDMFYDESFTFSLYEWLKNGMNCGCSVLIGDPGRHALSCIINSKLSKLGEYTLPENSCLENRGFSSTSVWKLNL